jgi:hypothetical protein
MIVFIGLFDSGCDDTLHLTITLVSTDTSSLALLGAGFQRQTSASTGILNYPRPQLQLTTTEP